MGDGGRQKNRCWQGRVRRQREKTEGALSLRRQRENGEVEGRERRLREKGRKGERKKERGDMVIRRGLGASKERRQR